MNGWVGGKSKPRHGSDSCILHIHVVLFTVTGQIFHLHFMNMKAQAAVPTRLSVLGQRKL